MLKRATAIILLFLALSPFTASFSSWDGDNDSGLQIAPVESVFVSRLHAQGLVATSLRESGCWVPTPMAGLIVVQLVNLAHIEGLFTRLAETTTYTGDYPISTAVLRL